LWSVTVASGAGQSVTQAAPLGAVVLQVADGAGHPLQGATVMVYQTAYAWEGVCAALGPCPAAPVLAASKVSATSDVNGQVQVTPLRVAGMPQVVKMTAVTGTSGAVSTTLSVAP
jgi:UDP-N-acetylmuramyl tripeptide synthase